MKVVASGPIPVREIENMWIPMPDGTRLAARVWLPADAERKPVPAIVEYIPYRKRDGTAWRDGVMQPYIAGHGYAVLRIDLRGTGDSDGLIQDEYTKAEHDDGVAALAWIAGQPWCTGRIGMVGMSWGGFNALQIAQRRPPALAAIISICAADDRYSDDAHYMGGAVLSEHAVWGVAILAQAALPPDPAIVGAGWREMWQARLAATPTWVASWLKHQRRDAYWRYGSVSEDYGAIACPVYAVGGWADAYSNAVPRLLQHLSVPSKGLIGPWAHGWPFMGAPGPAIGFLQEMLRWWDQWLKGIETGIMHEPRYRVWMQEAMPRRPGRERQPGRWVSEPSWPSANIVPHHLHLNPGRLAATAEAEIPLSLASPQFTGKASGSWCPYATGSDLDGDQREDDGNSLAFDSALLAEGLEILGAPVVELDLAVDRPVALIAARLCDVDPAGASARVTYGVLNLTHRDSHAEPTPLEPGRRYRVRLQLNDVAYGFPAGHRLRLALSTCYWPIVWPAPEPVTITVFTASSRLTLPERRPRPEDAELASFGEPEGASEPPMTTLATGSGSAFWRHDVAAGTMEIAIEHDGGVERFDAIGMAVGMKIVARYGIAGNDPLSAKAELAWTITRQRGSWGVRIEAGVELSCTQDAFLVRQTLAAYEGDASVYAQTWNDRIARDLV
ncbi:MAG: CocE/NonD family hydrolase [Proteobacteria bacterium]|nr:CocE/NonD family hydrolase [Pseudomonadota bacterium]